MARTLVALAAASLGALGPRAQRFALESPHSETVRGDVVRALSGMGDAGQDNAGQDIAKSGNTAGGFFAAPIFAIGGASAYLTDALNRSKNIKAQGQADAAKIAAQGQVEQAAADQARQDAAARQAFAFAVDQLNASVVSASNEDRNLQSTAANVEQVYSISPGADPSYRAQMADLAAQSAAAVKDAQLRAGAIGSATQDQVEALAAWVDSISQQIQTAETQAKAILAAAQESAFAALRAPAATQDVLPGSQVAGGVVWKPLGAAGLGDAGILGGIFSFIPQLASEVPQLAASFGDRTAQQQVAQQDQVQLAQAQAAITPYTAQAAEAQSQASEVGYIAAGLAAAAVAISAGIVISRSGGKR